ncbi:beta family protein [Pectobacterium brasiliense]|uniref:beta family protein n=1 Tax=Pectobacterium brasiliense TaxID=180957 RepID=UPI0015DF1DA2|nr:beta family protein [Pectobacterium brasiliense]MBA0218817.1 beta family protein [Pectobacterium brasiliense]MBN3170594.1 beta family protein [Pectobacterium brasiliense]
MYPTYVPILKAKPGEFSALENLKPIYSDKITPFFEIPKFTNKIRELAYLKSSTQPKKNYLDKIANDIISSCKTSSLFFDHFEWKPNVYTETGEHVYSYMFRKLCASGLKIYPVIGLDRWDDVDYQNALRNLTTPDDTLYCLRIDSETIEDAYDEEHFIESIENIMDELHLTGEQLVVLFDFGDVTKKSIVSLLADMHHLLKVTAKFSFGASMIAGASFPTFINEAVKDEDSTGYVERREMVVWKTLLEENTEGLIFADYGIRNPSALDDVPAIHANGKIRHTINNRYFVARGHSKQKGNKGEQIYDLAKVIITSPHYLNVSFSWGDKKIFDCSLKKFKGRPQDWVGYDTNHHISYVVEEILEFERVRTAKKATVS